MAEVKFDINELYGKVRGWGMPFPELLRRTGSVKNWLNGIDKPTVDTTYNMLGKPIQSQLTLRLNNEELKFAIPPIMTIQLAINSVETVVPGLDGTVTEVIGLEDYMINIKGFLKTANSLDVIDNQSGYFYKLNPTEFPERELRQLRRFVESKKSLEVVESRILSIFNIKKIFVKDFNLPELEGYTFMCPFELQVKSDKDFVLKLSESDVQ